MFDYLHTQLQSLSFLLENQSLILQALLTTIGLFGLTVISSFLLGVVLALFRTSSTSIIKNTSLVYIELIRGTPLILVIFWIYFLLPKLINQPISPFLSAFIALTLFESAYLAEIIRAGIENTPKGQKEAAIALGLSAFQQNLYIVFPQALRNMFPSLVSQGISLFKDTSLAYIIGVLELTRIAMIINNRIYQPVIIFAWLGLSYFICIWIMSKGAILLENKLAITGQGMKNRGSK